MKKLFLSLFIIGAIITWSACEKNDTFSEDNNSVTPVNPTANSTRAAFKIHLTDTPGQYDEVNIDILQFTAKLDSGGWHTLYTNAGIYDLLLFQNGIDTTIVNDSLPAGSTIKELRMILGTNNTIVIGSSTMALSTPSGQSSGIKIKLSQAVVADSLNQITIDFDACKSIKKLGNGTYQLHPVIKVL